MNEIMEQLKQVIDRAKVLIEENDRKSKLLISELSGVKQAKDTNSAISDALANREAAIAKIENVVLIEEQSKQRLSDAGAMKAKNDETLKEIAEKSDDLAKREDELKQMIALYRSKNEAIEAEKVKMAEDRKNMRASIIEELKKIK
jgi:hypothetical protein